MAATSHDTPHWTSGPAIGAPGPVHAVCICTCPACCGHRPGTEPARGNPGTCELCSCYLIPEPPNGRNTPPPMTTGNRADDRNPGGRPRIGPPAKWALPRELRTALAAARRTRPDGTSESEAAAARRLLAAALNPSVAAALRMAAAAYDNGTAEPCRQLADELRDLADQLT